MSGPVAIQRLLEAWGGFLTLDEAVALGTLHDIIAEAIRRAQKVPATIDRRCLALVVTKLEEAEHWAIEARRREFDHRAQAAEQGPGG
jgi:hypothetical protein